MGRGWRVVLDEGFPRGALGAVAFLLVVTGGFGWGVMCSVPAENKVIDYGTRATAHVTTWNTKDRAHFHTTVTHNADLTWQDAHGRPRSWRQLRIGDRAYAVARTSNEVEILYIEEDPSQRPVVVADIEHRERENSDAPVGLALCGLGLVFALVFLFRGLGEWRAAERAKTDPPPPPPW